MNKVKIAISIDKNILDVVDSKIDNSIIRSRSQAIEYFLQKGLKEQKIETAVILLRGDQHEIVLKQFQGSTLIKKQLDFFLEHQIKSVFLVTQHSKYMNAILEQISESNLNVKILESDAKGNAEALLAVRDVLQGNFVVLSGDTYNEFDLQKMITKHLESGKVATMGLMTADTPSDFGSVSLDGDVIVSFEEKAKSAQSHVVNAGFYIFSKKIFSFFDKTISLEKDLFPKLAKENQLIGFFTHGLYKHFE